MPTQRTKQTQDEALAKHVLEALPADKIQAFYIREPGTRMMSTLLVFNPEGIVLMGDLCPKRNGVISAYGYDLGWFVSRLSEDYLAEKFLERKWLPAKAAEWCDDTAEELRAEAREEVKEDDLDPEEAKATIQKAEDRASALDDLGESLSDDCGQETFNSEANALGYCDAWEIGYGYDPDEVAWLIAIQKAFARLYNARKGTDVTA